MQKVERIPKEKQTPMIPYKIPFIGSLLDFGMRPLDFFMENYGKVHFLTCC